MSTDLIFFNLHKSENVLKPSVWGKCVLSSAPTNQIEDDGRPKNIKGRTVHSDIRCQFHQRFTCSFYARRSQKRQTTLSKSNL